MNITNEQFLVKRKNNNNKKKIHVQLHYALKSVVKDIFNFPPMPFYDTLFKKDPLEGQ